MNDTPGNTPTSKKAEYILTCPSFYPPKEIIVHFFEAQGIYDARNQQKEFNDSKVCRFKTTLYLKVE